MILLVVDMQPRFEASTRGWLLRAVAREVRAARSAGAGIVFLEYTRRRGDGGVPLTERTHRRLTDLVADYDDAVTVHKGQDDGSAAVLRAAEEWYGDGPGSGRHIDGGVRVVGVNTEACVASTVNGLSAALPDLGITVVGGACNGHGGKAPSNAGHEQIATKGRNVRVLAVERVGAAAWRPSRFAGTPGPSAANRPDRQGAKAGGRARRTKYESRRTENKSRTG